MKVNDKNKALDVKRNAQMHTSGLEMINATSITRHSHTGTSPHAQ